LFWIPPSKKSAAIIHVDEAAAGDSTLDRAVQDFWHAKKD
jgi:hypothetical protein